MASSEGFFYIFGASRFFWFFLIFISAFSFSCTQTNSQYIQSQDLFQIVTVNLKIHTCGTILFDFNL
ncbi:unnamed protein product [Meloidogyne enterolobii]|uniref:Uncharacterized protein n=1 Tax=Meloidogyne enterolobii TaxID=390850 RepID=A0ACB1AW64_MELEN